MDCQATMAMVSVEPFVMDCFPWLLGPVGPPPSLVTLAIESGRPGVTGISMQASLNLRYFTTISYPSCLDF